MIAAMLLGDIAGLSGAAIVLGEYPAISCRAGDHGRHSHGDPTGKPPGGAIHPRSWNRSGICSAGGDG